MFRTTKRSSGRKGHAVFACTVLPEDKDLVVRNMSKTI